MKIKLLITAGILATTMASQAAVMSTSSSAPTSGDYFSDAFSTIAGSAYRTDKRYGGQSFVHTTTDNKKWELNSITFLGFDGTNVDLSKITMHVFEGNGTSGTQLGSGITFGTGTVADFAGKYFTMSLTEAETDAIGELTSGEQYTAVIITDDSTNYVRITRSTTDTSYTAGQGIYQNSPVTNGDAVFFVEGTVAVPEPSSAALLGLGGLALILRRRK